MTEEQSIERLYLSFTIGLGLVCWGLGNALLVRINGRSTRGLSLGVGLASGLLVILLIESLRPRLTGSVAIGCATAFAALAISSLNVIRRQTVRVVRFCQQPLARWGLVGIAGGCLILFGIINYQTEFELKTKRNQINMGVTSISKSQLVMAQPTARTDLGRSINIMRPEIVPNRDELLAAEITWLQQSPYWDKVIHLKDKNGRGKGPDSGANCHGWVFAEGRFVIPNSEVDGIIADHGYYIVEHPQVSDIVIYRDEKANLIQHSAVVRSILEDGTILVEGKWGILGVFLHEVSECGYGKHQFYRSDRGNHTLAGIETTAN